MRIDHLASLLFGSAALLTCGPAWSAPRQQIAVLDAKLTNVDAQFGPLLTEVITSEVHALGRFSVIAGRDISAMLDFETQRELVACDEVACLAQVGGALGVEYILVPDIGVLGKSYVVNIKLINIRTPKVEGRVYETVQGEMDVLVATIKRSVARLFDSAVTALPTVAPTPAAPTAKPVAAPAAAAPGVRATRVVAAPPAMTTFRSAVPGALFGAGAIAAGVGVYFGIQARDHHENAADPTYVGRQAEIAPGKRAQIVADVAFGVALVSAGAGVWVGLRLRDKPVAVALRPTPGGAMVSALLPFDLATEVR
ncbi:MAG: hypothetical protein AAB426_12650 [Myxococcota bacterium]